LAKSNFAVLLKAVGRESKDVDVHRFGHWGPGWFEIILVRPGSEAETIADDCEAALADYPVLDDYDYSQREQETYLTHWFDWGAQDFVRDLQIKFHGELSDTEYQALSELDLEYPKLRAYFEDRNTCGDYLQDGRPMIRRSVSKITIETLRAFMATLS
jgi:hypothetical protein